LALFQSISKWLHAQCLSAEAGSRFPEAAVETRVMGDYEDDAAKQMVDSVIVNA
jgi:hypothetical protein